MELNQNLFTEEIKITEPGFKKNNSLHLTNNKKLVLYNSFSGLQIIDFQTGKTKKYNSLPNGFEIIQKDSSEFSFKNYLFFFKENNSIFGFDYKLGKKKYIFSDPNIKYAKVLIANDKFYIFYKKLPNNSKLLVYDMKFRKRLLWFEIKLSNITYNNQLLYSYLRLNFRSKNLISCKMVMNQIGGICYSKNKNYIENVQVNIVRRRIHNMVNLNFK